MDIIRSQIRQSNVTAKLYGRINNGEKPLRAVKKTYNNKLYVTLPIDTDRRQKFTRYNNLKYFLSQPYAKRCNNRG